MKVLQSIRLIQRRRGEAGGKVVVVAGFQRVLEGGVEDLLEALGAFAGRGGDGRGGAGWGGRARWLGGQLAGHGLGRGGFGGWVCCWRGSREHLSSE